MKLSLLKPKSKIYTPFFAMYNNNYKSQHFTSFEFTFVLSD